MHEIGHTFDLLHTHQSHNSDHPEIVTRNINNNNPPCSCNCNTRGDYVCDTPADPRWTAQNIDVDDCVIDFPSSFEDNCGDRFIDNESNSLYVNFMSYYNFDVDECTDLKFTYGQVLRMKNALETYQGFFTFDDAPIVSNLSVGNFQNIIYEDENFIVNGENSIHENGSLTLINSVIHMEPGSSIIVNGDLVLDNTTIKLSDCSTGLWDGITVNGKIEVKNNSIISGADIAIKSVDNPSSNPILFNNSNIINCLRAFDFRNIKLEGWFKNNTFKTDFQNTSLSLSANQRYIYAINSQDLCLLDCTIDINTWDMTAVHVSNTNFVCIAQDRVPSIRSRKSAVKAFNTAKIKVLDTEIVSYNPFNISLVNTFISKRNSVTNVFEDIFNIPDEGRNELELVENFEIQNCDFYQSDGYDGILINGESIANNIIENNIFHEGLTAVITSGNQGQDQNDVMSGVQFKCNDIRNNNSEDFLWNDQVGFIQGVNDLPAGNVYSNNIEFDIKANPSVDVQYVYSLLNQNEEPRIDPNAFGIVKFGSDNENSSCDPGSNFTEQEEDIVLNFYTIDTTVIIDTNSDDVIPGLESLIVRFEDLMTTVTDNGDSESLISLIENSSSSNPVTVLNQLQTYSPNLSSNVCIALLNNSEFFTESEIVNILLANPHVLTNNEISCIFKNNNFNNENTLLLQSALFYPSFIQEIKVEMNTTKNLYNKIVLNKIGELWQNGISDPDLFVDLISKLESKDLKLWISLVQFNKGGRIAYEAYVNSLTKTIEEESLFNELLWLLELTLFSNIDSVQSIELNRLTLSNSTFISEFAQNIMYDFNGTIYPLREFSYSCQSIEFLSDASSRSLEDNDSVFLHPNPFSGTISVNQNTYEKYRIINLDGKILKSGSLVPGVTHLDLSMLDNGVYYLSTYKRNLAGEIIKIIKAD